MKKFYVIFLAIFLMIGVFGCQSEKEGAEEGAKGESTKIEQGSECG